MFVIGQYGSRISARRIFARRTSAHPDICRRIFARLIHIFCFPVILLLVLSFLLTLFLFLFNISNLKQGYKSLRTLLHSPNLT